MSEKKPEPEDLLMMGPAMDHNLRPYFRRNSEGIQTGLIRPIKDGEPIGEDAMFLEHKGPGPLYQVRPIFEKTARSKPATKDYLDGWERVFGGRGTIGEA